MPKSWAEKETALIATQHENDHLKKEIEQLSGRNVQLDFQLRQLQVLTICAWDHSTVGRHLFEQRVFG